MQPPATTCPLPRPALVLVGASVRAAAQSARRGGFSVIGVDRYGDLDTLEACHEHHHLGRPREGLPEWLQARGAATCFVGGLAGELADGKTAELKNPLAYEDLAAEAGLAIPETVDSPPDGSAGGRWLRKSVHSSGGCGVTVWPTLATLAECGRGEASGDAPGVGDAPGFTPGGEAIWQRFVAGRACGAAFFTDRDGTVLLDIFRSLIVRRGQHPFLYAGSVSGALPESPLRARLLTFAEGVADRYALRGLFNVDLVIDPRETGWILEINPRWTAASELVERRLIDRGLLGHGDSLMRRHVLAQGNEDSGLVSALLADARPVPPHAAWCKRIIYAGRAGTIDIKRLRGIEKRHPVHFCDLPPPSRQHAAGEPLLTVIAKLGMEERPVTSTDATTSSGFITPFQLRNVVKETLGLIQPSHRDDTSR